MNPLRVGVAVRRDRVCGIRDYAERLAAAWGDAVAVRWIDLGPLRAPADWRGAARSARDLDVVHVHYEYNLFRHVSPLRNRYADFMRALQVPAVVTLHDAFPRLWHGWADLARSGPAAWLRQALYLPHLAGWETSQYRLAVHSVAHTAAITRRAAQAAGEAAVTLTPHPVPRCAAHWRPVAAAARPPRLVTPGFIKEHKGYEDALDLMAAQPEWEWVLAGAPQDQRDAAFERRFRTTLAARGLTSRVRLTGYLEADDLERVTADADAALFPFRRATGSGSVALAIGLGMPILAADVPSLRELPDAGMVFLDPASRAGWPRAAERLLGNGAALDALAEKNRAFAKRHGYDAFARRMATRLREAARGGTSGEDRP